MRQPAADLLEGGQAGAQASLHDAAAGRQRGIIVMRAGLDTLGQHDEEPIPKS